MRADAEVGGTVLRAQELSVGRALGCVSLTARQGECLGVIGSNGAGKSTLLAALAGVVPLDRGRVERAAMAYLPEGGDLDPSVSVRRWLQWGSWLPGWNAERVAHLVARFDLDQGARIGALSQGQRVRLGLVLALGRDRPLYLLDDPFLGLDPLALRCAEEALADRSAEAAVVVAGQHIESLERLCTHLLLLDRGRVVWQASLDEWRARFRAVRVAWARSPGEPFDALVVERRDTPWGVELLLDDPDADSERWFGTLGLVPEALPLPLERIVQHLVVEARRAA